MKVVGRMVDGSEIVGELTGETEDSITVSYPFQIITKWAVGSPLPLISFNRFMPFAARTDFTFQKVDFIVLAEAVDEMEDWHDRMIRDYDSRSSSSKQTDKEDYYKSILQDMELDDVTKQ